ncbi:MAG TPA: DHH family phosphoesterase [Candidatus Thermoplasmatota archaeon]|nr:DHH family phosphoesterase [Candidatus Thermoplasmatota archaeon]
MDALLARLADARGSVLWLMHVNADPDCVGSTFALREAFGGVAAAPGGMNRPGERLARLLAFEPERIAHPRNHALAVAVDTGSRSGLGAVGRELGDVALVDHHAYGDLHDTEAKAWDPERASCAEVVLALLDRAQKPVAPAMARALLAGVVTDTARFRYADAHALRAAARLQELAGVRLEEVYDALRDAEEDDDDAEARAAALKAAQRADVERAGRFLLASSEVGSWDAVAANALVRAGADVALVGTERSQEARMSLRASSRARPLHLGELANEVARELGWSGGGHEGAAGLRGAPPLAPARDAMLAALRARLEAM